MKQDGRHALGQAISRQAAQEAHALVAEFVRLKAGQRVLKDMGIRISAIDNGDIQAIVAALLKPGEPMRTTPMDISVRPPDAQMEGLGPSVGPLDGPLAVPLPAAEVIDSSDLEDLGLWSEYSDAEEAGVADPSEAAVKHSRGEGHSKGHGKGHGKSRGYRPPRLELEQWAAGLADHPKFSGVSKDRYRGMEFKRVLLNEVTAAGLGTKPSELKPHKTLPTELNCAASHLCHEAGTQATCECHSAGTANLEPRLQAFLSECVGCGLTRVNVVTGLGSHGGGGTIRQLMPALLQASPSVRSFQLASNFSAFYVDL